MIPAENSKMGHSLEIPNLTEPRNESENYFAKYFRYG